MDTTVNDSRSSRERVLSMIDAAWMCQAIGAACELDLADQLGARATHVEHLAAAVNADADAVARLLRALCTLGLCDERGDGSFALTADGQLLRSDAPLSVHGWARMSAARIWGNWAGLAESVRTGKSNRLRATGTRDFSSVDRDPRAAEGFNRAMASLTRPIALAAANEIDWSAHRHIVDVGAGPGELVATILERHTHLSGVAFDMQHAVQPARERIGRSRLEARCTVESGSFFESVPAGGDAYLLKSVLHNWGDGRAIAILRNVRAAMAPGAVLYLFERVMPARYSRSAQDQEIARSDLNMLVGCDGRERTGDAFRHLLRGAGFALQHVRYLAAGASVLHCVTEDA